jgi:hypothetical protein
MSDDDLDLVETDRLCAAFHRRCDVSALIGVSQKNSEADELIVSAHGSALALSTLLIMASDEIIEPFRHEMSRTFRGE